MGRRPLREFWHGLTAKTQSASLGVRLPDPDPSITTSRKCALRMIALFCNWWSPTPNPAPASSPDPDRQEFLTLFVPFCVHWTLVMRILFLLGKLWVQVLAVAVSWGCADGFGFLSLWYHTMRSADHCGDQIEQR